MPINYTRSLNEGQDAEFEAQIVAQGAYVDQPHGDGTKYIVETATLRLNWKALNAWHNAHTCNCRDCYEDGPAGDAEWKAVLERNSRDQETFTGKIRAILGIGTDGSLVITQALSEVFTAVHIYRV